jgi:hypothetical protein
MKKISVILLMACSLLVIGCDTTVDCPCEEGIQGTSDISAPDVSTSLEGIEPDYFSWSFSATEYQAWYLIHYIWYSDKVSEIETALQNSGNWQSNGAEQFLDNNYWGGTNSLTTRVEYVVYVKGKSWPDHLSVELQNDDTRTFRSKEWTEK